MTFQALLFCEDEKTARLTTQVLNDLEFSVEACNEPFAAVKKLMGQHFDALVVDCNNEQNAALLFKSARNSSSNQSSLAVAVVEGQSGVANAFRIGANLVLTKPLNVEQAKGTLRVARGLLKKSGESAKPVSSAPAAAAQPPSPAPPQIAPEPARPAVPPPSIPKPGPVQNAVAASAAPRPASDPADLFEIEPAPAAASHSEEILLDALDEPAPPKKTSPAPVRPAPIGKERSWPSAPASSPQPAPPKFTPPVADMSPAIGISTVGGAASAPAPAKELPRTLMDTLQTPVREEKPADSAAPVAASQPARTHALDRQSAPTFAQLSSSEPSEGLRGWKVALIVVIAGVLVAAGYLGYTKLHQRDSGPAAPLEQESQSPAELSNSPAALAAQQPSAEVTATVLPPPAPRKPETTPASAPEPEVIVTQIQPKPTVVKSGTRAPAKPQEAEVEAPEMLGAAAGDSSAISSIVSSATPSVPVAAAPAEPLKVSQGVTQGLLTRRIQPIYPRQALQMRIAGSVQLQAIIGKTGSIESVKVLSGDAILSRAALDAVKQWKYKPYLLDNEPVEIQTQITVNFKLP